MDTPIINLLSLCSGAGQLDQGVTAALARRGIRTRHVAYAERETAPCAALRSRMEEQALEPAPIWGGNLQDFPAAGFHGLVDGIVAGFPCQPFSGAGLQLGPEDERHLLPHILDVADAVGATVLFLENVSGLKKWFDHITALLLQRGWNVEWGTLTASAVGASHKRDRWFGVAYREHVAGGAKRLLQPRRGSDAAADHGSMLGAPGVELLADGAGGGFGIMREPSGSHGQPDGSREELGNPTRDDEWRSSFAGRDGQGQPLGRSGGDMGNRLCQGCGKPVETHEGRGVQRTRSGVHRTVGSAGSGVADCDCSGCERPGQAESERWISDPQSFGRSLPVFAPGPHDPRWTDLLRRYPFLAPALPVSPVAMRAAWSRVLGGSGVEAESGVHLLAPRMAPALDFADTYLTTRADQLRIAGNGVCPQQAAWAYHQLLNRL